MQGSPGACQISSSSVSPRGKYWDGPYLKIVHAVRQCDHEARVVVDGLVTENDVHPMVQIPEIVLGCRQLAAVVLGVVPV